jgi:hypothetical protein
MSGGLYQRWSAGDWVNVSQHLYTYNGNDNRTGDMWQTWDGASWVNSGRATLTYDDSNNCTAYLGQSWNGTSWVNAHQRAYTYDTRGNLLSDTRQLFAGSFWMNYLQLLYTYDANDNMTSQSEFSWNGTEWVIFVQYLESFDAANDPLGDSYKIWNDDGTQVESGDSTRNYYHYPQGIFEMTGADGLVILYPNPCHGSFSISSTSRILSVDIFDDLGRPVDCTTSLTGSSSARVTLHHPAAGIYFVRIQTSGGLFNRKVTLK